MSYLSLLGLVYTEWFLNLKRSIPVTPGGSGSRIGNIDGNLPDRRCHLLGKRMGIERQCMTWARCNGVSHQVIPSVRLATSRPRAFMSRYLLVLRHDEISRNGTVVEVSHFGCGASGPSSPTSAYTHSWRNSYIPILSAKELM